MKVWGCVLTLKPLARWFHLLLFTPNTVSFPLLMWTKWMTLNDDTVFCFAVCNSYCAMELLASRCELTKMQFIQKCTQNANPIILIFSLINKIKFKNDVSSKHGGGWLYVYGVFFMHNAKVMLILLSWCLMLCLGAFLHQASVTGSWGRRLEDAHVFMQNQMGTRSLGYSLLTNSLRVCVEGTET